jgi:hypothetical protein
MRDVKMTASISLILSYNSVQFYLERRGTGNSLACQTAKHTSKLHPIPRRNICPHVGVTALPTANLIAYAAYAGVKISEYLTRIASQKSLFVLYQGGIVRPEEEETKKDGKRGNGKYARPDQITKKYNGPVEKYPIPPDLLTHHSHGDDHLQN